MNYTKYIKTAIKVLIFDDKAYETILKDENSTKYGFLTVLLAGLATSIGSLGFIASPSSIVTGPILMVVGLFIVYSVYHFLAKFVFKGQATGTQYFRVLSASFILYFISVIPFIGTFLQFLAGLWILIVNIAILNKVHKLTMGKSIVLGLVLPIIVFLASLL